MVLFASSISAEETLTIALSGEIETLDPPFSQFQRSNEVNYNILDQFFRYGWNDTGKGYSIADTGNIEGSAFESWDWSDDKRSLTLTLRKGANFNSTGNSVTSADVLYWFERAYGTKAGTHWSTTAKIDSIDSVKVIDDRVVKLNFSAPSPWFFYLFRDQVKLQSKQQWHLVILQMMILGRLSGLLEIVQDQVSFLYLTGSLEYR